MGRISSIPSPSVNGSPSVASLPEMEPDVPEMTCDDSECSSGGGKRESSVTPVAKTSTHSFIDDLKSEISGNGNPIRRYTMSSVFNRSMHTIRKESKSQAKFILTLYGLIKKQTILVAISAASSVVLWALIIVDDMNSSLVHWDLIVNALCIWLMLASSNSYWKCCTKTLLWPWYRKEHAAEKNLMI